MSRTVTFMIQIDFDRDPDTISAKDAINKAIGLAVRPDFASIDCGTVLERVVLLNADCGDTVTEWLSRNTYGDYFEKEEER